MARRIPDNLYIYYNGSQSGTMQLWRMKPDGSADNSLDEYNDWFPHISPDGKWILFISFPAELIRCPSLIQKGDAQTNARQWWSTQVVAYLTAGRELSRAFVVAGQQKCGVCEQLGEA